MIYLGVVFKLSQVEIYIVQIGGCNSYEFWHKLCKNLHLLICTTNLMITSKWQRGVDCTIILCFLGHFQPVRIYINSPANGNEFSPPLVLCFKNLLTSPHHRSIPGSSRPAPLPNRWLTIISWLGVQA